MKLIRYEPGRSLLLILEGLPGTFGGLIALVILMSLTFGPMVFVALKVPDFGILLFTGLIALVGVVLLLVRLPRYLELRRDLDRWHSVTGSLGFMLPRSQHFQLSTIDRLELERRFSSQRSRLDRGKSPATAKPLAFDLVAYTSDGVELGHWKLSVENHLTLDDGVELLRRMADVIGLPHVQVVSRDPKRLQARASRAGDDAIPAKADGAIEGQDATPTAPAFNPQHGLPELGFAITRWAPGGQIRFAKPARWSDIGFYPLGMTVVVALLASLQVRPWTAELFPALPVDLSTPGLLVVAIPVWCIAVGGTIFAWRSDRRFGVVVDWPYRRFRIRRGKRTLEIPFSRLDGFELRGIVSEVSTAATRTSHAQSRTRTVYSLSLVARFSRPDRAVVLVDTHRMRGSCDERVYEYMHELTKALSEALDVAYRFRDFSWQETYAEVE